MLWPILGALVGGAILSAIAWHYASGDINSVGNWKNGAAKFVGMAGAIGLMLGWYGTLHVTRGAALSRTGLTLGYKRIDPTATGYRELATLTVEDLLVRLREFGYQPSAKACDDSGAVLGPTEGSTPLAGANFAITDAGVKGWIRVQLGSPPEGYARAMGLIETWTKNGESATELALFALRALDGMLGDLSASHDDSALTGTPAKLFVSSLPDHPKHRR